MIDQLLAQAERLNPMQQSVRLQFQEGGSALGVVLTILLITAAVWFAWAWSRRAERNRRPGAGLDAAGVFAETLRRLDLVSTHKELLTRAALTSKLKHPSVLLLCPSLFDRYVGDDGSPSQVGSSTPNARCAPKSSRVDRTLSELRAYLFPGQSTESA